MLQPLLGAPRRNTALESLSGGPTYVVGTEKILLFQESTGVSSPPPPGAQQLECNIYKWHRCNRLAETGGFLLPPLSYQAQRKYHHCSN